MRPFRQTVQSTGCTLAGIMAMSKPLKKLGKKKLFPQQQWQQNAYHNFKVKKQNIRTSRSILGYARLGAEAGVINWFWRHQSNYLQRGWLVLRKILAITVNRDDGFCLTQLRFQKSSHVSSRAILFHTAWEWPPCRNWPFLSQFRLLFRSCLSRLVCWYNAAQELVSNSGLQDCWRSHQLMWFRRTRPFSAGRSRSLRKPLGGTRIIFWSVRVCGDWIM